MTHAHSHVHGDTGNIKVAFFLNLGFTLVEIIGGLAINSIAIISDALHDLGDSISLGLAWFLSNYAEKGSNDKYSYGYRRFSLLGALINAIVLIAGSVVILTEAVPRLLNPEEFHAPGMIAFALLGIVVNGAAALRLRGSGSTNAQVVGVHLLEDVLGWVAVLIVGLISLVVDVPVLDPLLSIGITAFILFRVLGKLKNVVELFLQAVPDEANLRAIRERFEAFDAVCSTHHIHLWSLDGEHHVLTAHIVVDEDIPKEEIVRIKQESKAAVAALDLEIEHITLEIEFNDEDCSMHADGHAHAAHAHAGSRPG